MDDLFSTLTDEQKEELRKIQENQRKEAQEIIQRHIDKLNLKIVIAETLFIVICLYLIFSDHAFYAIWLALWRIGFVLSRGLIK